MTANAVPGFLPSVNGFHFPNWWPANVLFGPIPHQLIPSIGGHIGLCGGMAVSARDIFENQLVPPVATDPFERGTDQAHQIIRRQLQTFELGRIPLRYYVLQALRADPPTALGRLLGWEPPRVDTYRTEWPKIKAEIDAGVLPVVGLVRKKSLDPLQLTQNHQVLAFAYDESPSLIRIRIYDPNHPNADDVELRIMVGGDETKPWRDRITIRQTTNEDLFGFFLHGYMKPESVKAWR